MELTVELEDRLKYSNALKAEKYADLSMDLEAAGLFPIKVGARGMEGRSTYAFLFFGLSSQERTKAMIRMFEAAKAVLFWI